MDIMDEIVSKSKPINKTANFDSKEFKKQYLNKGTPVVLKGYGNNWPAIEKWNLDYLSGLETEKPVSLEIGSINQSINQTETNFVKQNLSSYIKSIKDGELNNDKDPAYLI